MSHFIAVVPGAWKTARMADTAHKTSTNPRSAVLTTSRRPNPALIVLTATTAFVWLLAFMLWIVLVNFTDYTTYDLDTAAALTTWITILIIGGVVTAVGATVIVGVRHELRTSAAH